MKKANSKPAISESKIGLSEVPFNKVALALSGGLDSVALFHLLLAHRNCCEVIALHVNFGLRGKESLRDEMFCRKLCAKHGVELHVLKISAKEKNGRKGESLQEWARRIRYEYFEKFKEQGFTIATAHHKDDLIENFYLRLFRGHSATDLLGMDTFKSSFWRPLLGFSRENLENYAKKHKIKFCKDSSNDKSEYSRNLLRNKILPAVQKKFPSFGDSSVRAGKLAFELGQFFLESQRSVWERDEIGLDELKKLSKELQIVLLKQFIRHQSENKIFASQNQLEVILSYEKPTALDLSPHWRLVRDAKSISLKKI